jgi:siroheme synthase-like protein
VISASDDNNVNQAVHNDCRESGIPVNVVDNPGLCDFIFPAVIRRDCLSVAVSTDGKAPFLSGHLRLILENIFAENRWLKIAKLAADFRKKVHRRWVDNPEKRSGCFSRFLEADWQTILKEKNEEEIELLTREMIET